MEETNKNIEKKEKNNSFALPKNNDIANPFTRYQHRFSTSFATVIFGLLLVIFGFIMLGYSEALNTVANSINKIPLEQAEELTKIKGMVKIQGKAKTDTPLYQPSTLDEEFIYYRIVKEETINNKLVPVQEEKKWTLFEMGNVKVIPNNAELYINYDEATPLSGTLDLKEEDLDKLKLLGIPTNSELIVIGYLKNNVIQSGNPFIITNYSHKNLIDELEGDKTVWWLLKIVTGILLTIGFFAFFVPILVFLDIFKVANRLLGFIIFILSLTLSGIFVFLGSLIVRYWWISAVLILLLVYWVIKARSKKGKNMGGNVGI